MKYIKIISIIILLCFLINNINSQITPKPCTPTNCNGNGICDTTVGSCVCFVNWATVGNDVCLIINHYISSTSQVSLENGGNLSLYGYFGDDHNNLVVTIQYTNGVTSSPLKINSKSNDTITVDIIGSAKASGKIITVSQNGITWSGLTYPYENTVYSCLNNCDYRTSGTCNTNNGTCTCFSGQIGLDCERNTTKPYAPSTIVQINETTGSTVVSNGITGYEISVLFICEVNGNGQILIYSCGQLKDRWTLVNSANNTTIFSQTVNTATITLTLVNDTESANITHSISVSNWLYKSNVNTLQIQFQINLIKLVNDNPFCGVFQADGLLESSSNNINLENNINNVKITRNDRYFYTSIGNSVISDGQLTFTTTNLILDPTETNAFVSKVTFGINLPHCKECNIYNISSSLFNSITYGRYEECIFDSSESSVEAKDNSWIIIVAVVVPVVVVSIIIISFCVLCCKGKITANDCLDCGCD